MRDTHAAVVALLLALPCLAAAAPPPVEDFTAYPRYDSLAISPGGTHLALTQREGDKHLLTVVDFPSMKPVRSFSFGDRIDVEDVRWADETRVLIQPSRLIPELAAYKMPTGEIIRADVDTGKTELLYRFALNRQGSGSLASKRDESSEPAQLLSMRTGDPSQVLIRVQGYAFEKILPSAYWMNVQSGKLKGAGASPAENGQFITGPDDRIDVVYGVNANNETTVYFNPPDDATVVDGHARNWIKQVTTGGDAGEFYPVAWTGKGEEYYALDSRGAVTLGVVVWDAAANTQRLLYRNPDFDMRPAARDPAGRPWVFQSADAYPFYWYPDPEHPLVRMHRTLVQQFPRHFIDVVSQTKDMSVAIVRLSAADRPPTFLVVDVRSVKPLQLMPTYPALKAVKMATVDAIEFRARDGLSIHGYVTAPRGADGKPERKLPTVVMIHGGPFGIVDSYRYNFERQLLASRGYAVLQINYRGSGGRGTAYERAGYGKWGREMQDDITDGVRWAIQEGVADAAHVCIYGGSYGAYAALTGAYREPSMFKCAVGMSGVYDLPLMFDRGDVQMFSRGVNYLKEALGQDKEDLRARSPVYNAKAIQAKVLLLHGANDQRAPLAHAERLRKALIEAGNPPEWLVETGESHGFFSPAHRAEAYGKILEFIDRNIGH